MKAYPFIAAEKAAERNVARACALLSVSRSAYYEWSKQRPSRHQQEDDDLRKRIRRIHRESRATYGAPRIHRQLREEGVHSGRKRVARLMAEEELQGRQKRRSKRTTIPDDNATAPATDLLGRDFATQERLLNQVWVGDIERHEALLNRAVMKGHRRQPVAAGWRS